MKCRNLVAKRQSLIEKNQMVLALSQRSLASADPRILLKTVVHNLIKAVLAGASFALR